MFFNHVFEISKNLVKDRAGNFAMATALMSFPMIAMMGLSVDLWQAFEVKTKLDQAADAAAIAAITTSSKAYANAMNGNGKADWDIEAQSFFAGNKVSVAPELQVDVSADVQRSGLLLSSTVNYVTDLPTVFMKLAGLQTMRISGSAKAEFNVGEYYDVNVLVDNSPSMGIGASQADVDAMEARMGCAFACHDASGNKNNLPVAMKMGVKLRIDVVASSLTKLADMVANNITQKNLYKLSLYTLGAKAEDSIADPLARLQSATQDMKAFKKSVKAVRLMSVPITDYNRYAVGYLNQSIELLGNAMPPSGNGTGVYDAKQVLLFITDGVEDKITTPSGCSGTFSNTRCTQPIDVKLCEALKRRGITIAILHTLYLPITTNSTYDNWIRGIAPKIGPALQECASPNLYQPVDINSDIATGLSDLFKRAVGMPRLTG